jgi:para-aminobenzoate synthetase component 1
MRRLLCAVVGFFSPDPAFAAEASSAKEAGTADLNVVIRTVLYDSASGDLSLCTGSAITAVCDPEKEWEECELKARSVINALSDADGS